MTRRLVLAVVATTLVACSDNTGPTGVPDTQLHIVRQDPVAPALIATKDSFYAKVGEGRELRFKYQSATPGGAEDDFLRFEVPGDGLFRKPDGSAFQAGDSVKIIITILDAAKFQFQFEPSGLQFSVDHPARLKLYYYHADHDFDGNGVIDPADDAIEHLLDLWRREGPSAAWFRIGSVKFEALDEIDANIFSFSEYALAW